MILIQNLLFYTGVFIVILFLTEYIVETSDKINKKIYFLIINLYITFFSLIMLFGILNYNVYINLINVLDINNNFSSLYYFKTFLLIFLSIFSLSIYSLVHILKNTNFQKSDFKEFKFLFLTLILLPISLIIVSIFNLWDLVIIYAYLILEIALVFSYHTFIKNKSEKKLSNSIFMLATAFAGLTLTIVKNYNSFQFIILMLFSLGFMLLSFVIALLTNINKNYDDINRIADESKNKSKEYYSNLKKIDETDNLTNIGNIKKLNKNISDMITNNIISEDNSFALLLLNIDNFKNINNYYGFEQGDKILIHVANFLNNQIIINRDNEENHSVYRISADQFAIIYNNTLDESIKFADYIISNINSITKNIENYSLNISVGITELSLDKTFNLVYTEADLALHEAKKTGKNKYCIYNNKYNILAKEKIEYENLIKHKLEKDEFILYCQPKVDVHSQKIIGGEILIRMKDINNENFIPPDRFIPIAEESDLINEIDQWVLWNSIKFIKELQDNNISVPISINVSSKEFLSKDFLKRINEILNNYQVNKDDIVIEITETSLISNINYATEIANELRKTGIKLSLDDFGVGYSSLNYLINLPVNEVKIDRSLIINLIYNDKNFIFLKNLIKLLHSINMNTIVEGVETSEQLEKIILSGATSYQGYFAERPIPLNEFKNKLEKQVKINNI